MAPSAVDEDYGKNFFSDLLRHVALNNNNNYQSGAERDEPYITCRDLFNGTREDVSTESGVTVSDESSLLMEARPSPVDLSKQKEIVTTLVKLLQVNKKKIKNDLLVHWDSLNIVGLAISYF